MLKHMEQWRNTVIVWVWSKQTTFVHLDDLWIGVFVVWSSGLRTPFDKFTGTLHQTAIRSCQKLKTFWRDHRTELLELQPCVHPSVRLGSLAPVKLGRFYHPVFPVLASAYGWRAWEHVHWRLCSPKRDNRAVFTNVLAKSSTLSGVHSSEPKHSSLNVPYLFMARTATKATPVSACTQNRH